MAISSAKKEIAAVVLLPARSATSLQAGLAMTNNLLCKARGLGRVMRETITMTKTASSTTVSA